MSEPNETREPSDLATQALMAATWVTCSPHEWVWTQDQQVAMARFCISAAGVIGDVISDLERIVCTEEPDAGVILLSSEGGSHYDDEAGCEVYDHEHFSPLGDALIALYEKLSSTSYRMGSAALNQPAACGPGLTDEERAALMAASDELHAEAVELSMSGYRKSQEQYRGWATTIDNLVARHEDGISRDLVVVTSHVLNVALRSEENATDRDYLRKIVQEVEWTPCEEDLYPAPAVMCPSCRNVWFADYAEKHHTEDCRLAATLEATKH